MDAFLALDNEAFKGFSEDELKAFADYLDRVAVNMGGGRRLSLGDILDMQKRSDEEEKRD